MVSTAIFTIPVNTFACKPKQVHKESRFCKDFGQIKKGLTRRKVARRFWSIASSSGESLFIGI